MAADSVTELLDYEFNFEDAAKTFFEASAPSGYQVVHSLSETNLQTPRYEIRLEVGDAEHPIDTRRGGANPSNQDFVRWSATFYCRVITDNAVGQSEGVQGHTKARAIARKIMLSSEGNWNGTDLPYYRLLEIRPMACIYLTEMDFNVTEMTWDIKFEIKPDAWPS